MKKKSERLSPQTVKHNFLAVHCTRSCKTTCFMLYVLIKATPEAAERQQERGGAAGVPLQPAAVW